MSKPKGWHWQHGRTGSWLPTDTLDQIKQKIKLGSPTTATVFVSAAILVVCTMTFIYWIGLIALQSNRQLAKQRGMIELLHRLGSSLKEAESGQRGYLLTGEPRYLEPYEHALQTLKEGLAQIRRAVDRGELSGSEMARLDGLCDQKLNELERTIKLKRAGQTEAAMTIVRSNQGKELMDAIVSDLDAMETREVADFQKANRRADRATRQRNAAFFASAALNLAFLTWAYQRIAREIREREAAQAELRKSHSELEKRVEERTSELAAANRSLELTNAQLAAANKELEAFGYSVSHDLRAPLRHISSFIRLLEKNAGPSLDQTSLRQVRTIAEAAKHMGHLIDDLLVLSRIGRTSLSENNVNLGQLADEARKELAPEMAGRAIDWQVAPLPQVRGDPTLLRSAFVNLLSNAIKYTRQRNPACIQVGSREENGEIICFVRDNGAGFDMDYVDKLFGVFQRLHDRGDFEGTGIGLASVRRIVQRHGGRTWAEGQVDGGATFYFSLPKERLV